MPNGLPSNAFINKGRCAIGGTYMEITNKLRSSIIVVPNISILIDKLNQHPEIDIIYGDVGIAKVREYFRTQKVAHKIMTTPEGVKKLVQAAKDERRYEEIKSTWYLLLDEAHTFITEHYREDILLPFKYFWKFQHKAIISATPYYFSDERFQSLDYHEVSFGNRKLGNVTLVNAASVEATLDYVFKNRDAYEGNLHVILNSVNEIKLAIERSDLDSCCIFCADDDKHKNLITLGDLTKFYVDQPKTGIFKKVNFYTARYFEGWDLYDENATMILVTNIYKPHTMIGVSTKGKQAIGRLRNRANKFIHITNHGKRKVFKSVATFKEEYLIDAKYLLNENESLLEHHKTTGSKLKPREALNKFADVDKDSGIATLNFMKLDQQINESANNEIYNHIDYIIEDWEKAGYNVDVEPSFLEFETKTTMKRKSKAKELEEDFNALEEYQSILTGGTIFTFGQTLEERIKDRNPTAWEAWKYLNKAELEALKYNIKKVKSAVILKQNTLSETKLLKLLANEFTIGKRYSNKEVKCKLQAIYNRLEYRNEDGIIKTAVATHISEQGRFEVEQCKIKNAKGESEHGLLILRAKFALKIAA